MDTTAVVAQLRQERSRLDQAIAALEGLAGTVPRRGRPPKAASFQVGSGRGRRRMSAAARARIGAAKKAWWAKQIAQSGTTNKPTSAAKKGSAKKRGSTRHMSASARKRISAMMKARWAARKKQA